MDSIVAVETIAPVIARGSPPEYLTKGNASERKGTAPAEVSNSETMAARETIWRTFPMVLMARAVLEAKSAMAMTQQEVREKELQDEIKRVKDACEM